MAEYEDDLPIVVIEKHSGALGPFFWGALIGAGATLLFAPRSGDETRRELSESVRRMRRTADQALREVQDAASATLRDVRSEVEQQVGAARNAFDAGRQAARGARSDVGRRYGEGREAVRTTYRGGTSAAPDADAEGDVEE